MVDLFTEVYNWLPLCHLLDNKVLVMHGGLFAKVRMVLEMIYSLGVIRTAGCLWWSWTWVWSMSRFGPFGAISRLVG